MSKTINDLFRRKYVGVDLFNGKLKAFEQYDNIYIDKPIEEIFPSMLNNSYWYDSNSMKQIFTFVINNTKKSLFRPILYIAIPFEISKLEDEMLICKAALKSKWGEVQIISNILCSAVGSGIEVNEVKRKLYIYSLNNLTYIGLVFAGGIFNVNILKKGYNELTESDIVNNVETLLNQVSIELPEEFISAKLPQKT